MQAGEKAINQTLQIKNIGTYLSQYINPDSGMALDTNKPLAYHDIEASHSSKDS